MNEQVTDTPIRPADPNDGLAVLESQRSTSLFTREA